MKTFHLVVWILLAGVLLPAQTVHLGQHVFYNTEGPINLAVDAGLSMQRLESDYVPFVVYMGADQGVKADISRENVVFVYKDQDIRMPDIKVFRREYRSDNRDLRVYQNYYAGVESLVFTQMRTYRFQWEYDFFPARSTGRLVTDEGAVTSSLGFKSFLYIKNPGLKKDDVIVIKVFDKTNPKIWGACAVQLADIQR
jgi:hypothetical protein